MTIEQFEERVNDMNPAGAPSSLETTFGIFGDDPELDEIARLGREFRHQVNAEDQ